MYKAKTGAAVCWPCAETPDCGSDDCDGVEVIGAQEPVDESYTTANGAAVCWPCAGAPDSPGGVDAKVEVPPGPTLPAGEMYKAKTGAAVCWPGAKTPDCWSDDCGASVGAGGGTKVKGPK